MLAVALALSTAILFALNAIALRRATAHGPPLAGLLVSAIVSLPVIAMIVMATGEYRHYREIGSAAGLFALAGLVEFVIGGALFYTAISLIGSSRTSVLVGTYPVFSLVLAASILNEQIGLLVAVGGLLVILGPIVLARGEARSPLAPEPRSGTSRGILLALGAAAGWGLGPIFIKSALDLAPFPLLGNLIAYITSLAVMSALVAEPRFRRSVMSLSRQAVGWYVMAAIIGSVAQVLHFLALGEGDVSVVVLLIQTQVFFIILLTVLFNRTLETVRPHVIVGASLVVVGAGLIAYQGAG